MGEMANSQRLGYEAERGEQLDDIVADAGWVLSSMVWGQEPGHAYKRLLKDIQQETEQYNPDLFISQTEHDFYKGGFDAVRCFLECHMTLLESNIDETTAKDGIEYFAAQLISFRFRTAREYIAAIDGTFDSDRGCIHVLSGLMDSFKHNLRAKVTSAYNLGQETEKSVALWVLGFVATLEPVWGRFGDDVTPLVKHFVGLGMIEEFVDGTYTLLRLTEAGVSTLKDSYQYWDTSETDVKVVT